MHINVNHETIKFLCKFGQYITGFKSSIQTHVNTVHHGKSNDKIQCNECDKEFGRKYYLNQHVATANRGLKINCKHCCVSGIEPIYIKMFFLPL